MWQLKKKMYGEKKGVWVFYFTSLKRPESECARRVLWTALLGSKLKYSDVNIGAFTGILIGFREIIFWVPF